MATLSSSDIDGIVDGFKAMDAAGIASYYEAWADSYDRVPLHSHFSSLPLFKLQAR